MRILIAVDGSRYSEAVIRLIRALNIGSRAETTILTVIPEHVFLGRHTLDHVLRRSITLKMQMREAEEQRALELLAKAAEPLVAGGLRVQTVIRRGSPAEEIIKTCGNTLADLAVVGFKGISDVPEFLLGGVAQKVIRYAPCSVLVVKRETDAVNRVLVPLDGSKYSDETVQFLLQLPLPHRARVLLMTVVESFVAALIRRPTLDMEANRQILAELQKAEEEAAERLMAEAKDRFSESGYRVLTTVAYGDPSPEILREAVQRNVDLIALGAKGLTGAHRFLLGSVAQRIARYAECSVLIVKRSRA
jgi:nucleotide-binding universal stress UspA family protein